MAKALQHIADRVRPWEIVVFQRAVFAEKLGVVGRWMIKNVKAPVGDFRDRDANSAWPGTIAAQLKDVIRNS